MNDAYFVMAAIALAERITALDQKLLFYRVNIPSSLHGTISESPTDILYALISVQKLWWTMEYMRKWSKVLLIFVYAT